jgi:hypothetical protein
MSSSISSSASMPAFAARRFAAAEEDFLLPLALALRLANARASSLATMPSPVFLVRVTVPPMAICLVGIRRGGCRGARGRRRVRHLRVGHVVGRDDERSTGRL